jgi:hypothetical protein
VGLPSTLVRGLLLACVGLSSATAAAQDSDDAGEAKEPARTNVFFEIGVGPGWFHAGAGSEVDGRTIKGVALATELALGGKLVPSFAIGAAYIRDDGFELSAQDELIDGDEVTLDGVSMTFGMLAFFADWHPIGDDGIHLRGAVGIGTLGSDYPVPSELGGGTSTVSDNIIGWSFGCGYHRRLVKNFSIGVLARLNFANFEHDGANQAVDVVVATPSLLLTLGIR